MFARKKSSPIVLVTPGDVVSAQHLLKVQQNSLTLFFSRSYYSYKFVWLYILFFALGTASAVWLTIERSNFPPRREYACLATAVSVVALLEFVWRLSLHSLCEYVKEPLHWVDFAILVLWAVALVLLFAARDFKYFTFVLAVQVLLVIKSVLPFVYLLKRLTRNSRKDSNVNILNISHMPGEREEVEVIVLDDSSHNSQPTQHDHTNRQMVPAVAPGEMRVEKNLTYFSPKQEEAAMKLDAEEDN